MCGKGIILGGYVVLNIFMGHSIYLKNTLGMSLTCSLYKFPEPYIDC